VEQQVRKGSPRTVISTRLTLGEIASRSRRADRPGGTSPPAVGPCNALPTACTRTLQGAFDRTVLVWLFSLARCSNNVVGRQSLEWRSNKRHQQGSKPQPTGQVGSLAGGLGGFGVEAA